MIEFDVKIKAGDLYDYMLGHNYVRDEEGIHVSQNDTEEMQRWEDMVKAVSTGRSIIVYTSRMNACIFPKRELGDETAQVIQIISTHLPAKKVKIRQ